MYLLVGLGKKIKKRTFDIPKLTTVPFEKNGETFTTGTFPGSWAIGISYALAFRYEQPLHEKVLSINNCSTAKTLDLFGLIQVPINTPTQEGCLKIPKVSSRPPLSYSPGSIRNPTSAFFLRNQHHALPKNPVDRKISARCFPKTQRSAASPAPHNVQ